MRGRELLSLVGGGRGIPRAGRDGTLPLSFAQERLWFLRELAPESPFYNVPVRLRLRGWLDVAALSESFFRLASRHETLRTSFTEEGQTIEPAGRIELPVVNLEGLPRSEREKAAIGLSNEEASRPFDLRSSSLVRARLFRLSEDEHILGLTLHHIISDGWSMNVLLRDLAEIYDALKAGREFRLPELPIQYADFALWQREHLSGEVLARQIDFWRRKLEDLPALSLPFDHPRPKAQSYRGAREWLPIPEELSRRLRKLSQTEGVTLYTTLLAAFLLLLHRYTGEDDIFVGSPFAGRSRTELEELIGFFVNSLVLRVDLSGDPSFRDLLARAAQTAREAFDHKDAPFEKVVEALDPGRDLGENPLFQVVFALQNAPSTSMLMGGLEAEFGWAETGATRFDLEAHVWDDGRGLRLAFVYSTDLFEPETIRNMERRYLRLLEEAVEAPERHISELHYFDDEERERVLFAWNRTSSSYPREATIHGLFEEQVEKCGGADALVEEGGSMSYRELDRRANRLARYLKGKGVGPESLVAFSLDRGVSAIEAILGILKAGGAYVPIDPELPSERRRYLLEDTREAVLLTSWELRSRFAGYRGTLVVLEEIAESLAADSDEKVESGASASNLAYVIYTSGSTGRPKGVAVPHRGVVRLVKGTSYVEWSPADRFLCLAPLSFDASTFEIWGSLLNGASLFLYPGERPSLEELGGTLRARGITTLWLTGTLFHQMVEQEIENLSGVRQIVAGGEALSPAHVQRMIERLSEGARLVNGYGPTEGTTFTCCHPMSRTSSIGSSVPIGRPIENTRVYVLDRYGEPVHPGLPGELHVGGDGLARGYFGKPELTAENFVPDPFSGESGARLYRTGDLCRFLESGALEFLGRTDHQVKVRGFRIELSEVERALREIPEVADAVVLAREDAPGEKRLVAYVVASELAAGADRERRHVSEWRALFDDTYRGTDSPVEADFDVSGWNSSYTGKPIPAEEMREWVDATVERILGKEPSRVLEIGCGTGLLLYRIAPKVKRYVGWDLSSKAIAGLRERVASRPKLSRVELFEREALDFDGIEPGSFDTVILNSVTQYFPSADYLHRVLERVVEHLSPGGRVFVGDVRSLPLLEAFHTSVELERAGGGLTPEEIAERVATSVEEETELVLDPSFFCGRARRIPRVSAVEVLVKRGRYGNELTRFRYDVFLHVERDERRLEARALDWESLERLRAELRPGETLEVRGIGNGRLAGDFSAVDPELLWSLAEERGHALELSYSALDPFHLDALFRPKDSFQPAGVFWPSGESRFEVSPREANEPLRARLARTLVPLLRKRCQEILPEYMVPQAVVLLDRMPLGPTGKVDRKALPSPSRARADLVSDYAAPRSEVERTLSRIWTEVLGLDRVGVHDNFFELGGDSILGIGIVARARRAGLSLAVRQLFEHQTIAELASAVAPAPPVERKPAAAPGEVPLTPIQRWFFELDLEERHHFNQALLLELRRPLEPSFLQQALLRLEDLHDAFRLRFREDGGTWRQELTTAGESFPLEVVELEDAGSLTERATEVQRSLDLEKGPLARAVLFRLRTGEPDRLLLVAHHVLVDALSWRVLVEDLDRLLREPQAAFPGTSSFASWARELREHAGKHESELSYWLEQDSAISPAIPRDRPEGVPDFGSLDRVTISLDAVETETIERRDIQEVLLRALAEAFSSKTGIRKLRLALEGHGRQEVVEASDLSRTVGWFTSMFPFVVDLDAGEKTVPAGGVGYGLLRYLLRALPEAPRPEVSFTYLGRIDSMFGPESAFRMAKESVGLTQSPRGMRPHPIDVTARIQDRKLTLHWYFSRSVHDRKTIEDLAERHLECVRGSTKARFPEARLDASKLQELESRFGRDEIEDLYPLTPMQRGILFESFYQPEAGVYVEQYGLELEDVDVSSFLGAWQKVVDRHPALRTSIVGASWEEPHQLVRKRAELPVSHHDLRGLSADEREAWLDEHRLQDRKRGFDLEAPPLMRLALIRLDERRMECLWSFHHIVLDGWSVPLVLGEVFQIEKAISLPPARPFRDFVAWLGRQDLKKAKSFWREKLRGIEGPTPLPLQDPRSEGRSGTEEYGEERVVFARTTTEKLRSFAARSQVTVNTVVLGAWSMLLSRYCGEDEVVLGTTVSGRPPELEGVESMVGLFINTLPLRVRLFPDARVGSFLRGLQGLQLECREHEYSPLWQVQQWSELPPGVPLFETFFVFENYPEGALGREISGRSKPSVERSGYPLALAASLREELALRLFYDRNRFDSSSVRRLARHLEQLVSGMTEDGSARLSAVALLSSEERRLVLEEWNETKVPSLRGETVVDLFERAAAESPEAPAVISAAAEITYGQLNRRANRWAHRLRATGVGPEILAGVLLERGVDLVTAKLAILKAGGAYLPLDPDHPRPRLAQVLEDARPKVVLTDRRNRAFLQENGIDILDIDSGDGPETNPKRSSPFDSLAYAIYTSGSTGRPKGVAVSHRSLANLVAWHIRAYQVTFLDRASQIAAPGFDACAWEIWPHLASGASLHVPDEDTRATPSKLWRWLAEKGITIAFLPTPFAEAALAEPIPEDLALRFLLTGGDRLRSALSGPRPFDFVNHYGPTETAVVATSDAMNDVSPPPIGKPIDGTRVYILDSSLEAVPFGVKGEIVVAGMGVARGYLRAPDLTAERFVPDPFAGEGARMYRTGDLGRHRDDGRIEFLGRNDGQIQVRGFRVEISEVEKALLRHPDLADALVLSREDEPGRKRLVAYYVGSADAYDLSTFLREQLPAPMVPSAFVKLEALPLTSNGKVDRTRLPAPTLPSRGSRPEPVAPRNRTEAVLARIWAEVLQCDPPGIHEDFFSLGGDSILCIQIVAQARAAGIALTAKDVFEHPTIAGLAERRGASSAPEAEEEIEGPVPLTPIQRWFFEEELPEPHHFNQAFLFRLERPVARERLAEAIEAVHSHHDAFRLRFRKAESGWIQFAAPAGGREVPLTVFDLSRLEPEARVAELSKGASEIQRSFSLESGPLFRAGLFDFGSEEPGRLLLAAHHLVVDAVSWRILVEDLGTALDELDSAKPARLSPKTTSFAAWAHRLQSHCGIENELEHWMSLARLEPRPLPRDFPGGENRVGSIETVTWWSTEEEAASLFQQVPRAYNTRTEETLLAALVEGLSPWTGERRLLLTLEGHGREELFEGVDLTRTVGWFTSLVPVLLVAKGAGGPGEALKAVKEQLRAIPARGIGYGLFRHLSQDPAIRTELSRCRPEIAFNYLGRMDSVLGVNRRFALAPEPIGPTRSPRGLRRHLLEVAVIAIEGKLRFDWTFSRELHRRETIEGLASSTLDALRGLIAHCLEPSSGGYTPSDFALASLSQAQLDQILKKI